MLEQSRLRAPAASVQDRKCDLVLARYSPNPCMNLVKKKSGRLTEEWRSHWGRGPHTLPEGVRSSCTPKKPKLLTQHASPMLVKKTDLRIAEMSLRWIKQHH